MSELKRLTWINGLKIPPPKRTTNNVITEQINDDDDDDEQRIILHPVLINSLGQHQIDKFTDCQLPIPVFVKYFYGFELLIYGIFHFQLTTRVMESIVMKHCLKTHRILTNSFSKSVCLLSILFLG